MVMKLLRNVAISILFLILLVAVGYVGMVYTVHKTVLNNDFYKEEFVKYQIYSKASDAIFEAATNSFGNNVQLSEVQRADLRSRFDEALPPKVIAEKVNILVKSTLDYINGESNSINLTVDIKDQRTEIVAFLVYAAPIINPQLNNQMITPDMLEAQVSPVIPDSIDLAQVSRGSTDKLTELRGPVAKMNQYYLYAIIAIIIGLILIFLLLMNLKSFFKAVASNSIVAGASFIIPALIVPNVPLSLPKDIEPIAVGLLKDALHPMLILGIILVILGIVLFIASFFVPSIFINNEPKQNAAETDSDDKAEKSRKRSKN